MSQIALNDLCIRFRGPMLLDHVSAHVQVGQRIGLLGRNGAGKTTLLRILAGDVQPENGSVVFAPQTRVERLTQDVPADVIGTIRDVVLPPDFASHPSDEWWEVEHAVDSTLSQMQLDPAARFEKLSSGMKRRVLLAKSISRRPDVLLLDEPTNHLDLEAILWLEDFLSRWQGTLMFVTHDRTFLQRLATRIWEIDRGRLFDWSCDYETFLKRKEESLEAEEKQNALFDKKLAQEEVWIRQGIKARRTRNEGRVRALKAMREQFRMRRTPEGKAKLNIQDAQRSGALVADLKDVSFGYPDRPVVSNFSTTVMRGDKIGIVGPNGAGKTTLLKLLLGELQPQSGKVRLGTNLQLAYFDQLRDTLDPNKTVADNVGDGSDRLNINGQTKHIVGYLQDFLFTPDRARTEVRFLSGGERNRALLARLMTKPANVIVLDEPTNDLDSETLELLEDQLVAFSGTILVVSHDRTFLNNVVSSLVVYEEGEFREYDGGYDDWQNRVARRNEKQPAPSSKNSPNKVASTAPSAPSAKETASKRKKLSFNEQRELKSLPSKIETLEQKIESLHTEMGDPIFYKRPAEEIAKTSQRLQSLESELAIAFARWEELESQSNAD